jgi:DNA-binding transcriptional MerR regulator
VAKYNQHVRLPIGLFNHSGYLGLAEERKAQCLAILLVLLRFANPKTGSCYPRYSKIKDMIGLSRMTLYRCIRLMIDAKLLIKRRLSSTNLYTLAPIMLVNDVSNRYEVVSNRYLSGIHKVSINKTNINKTVLINNGMSINKIDKIVNSKDIDKQTKIVELASVPLPELRKCFKQHPYYIQQAIEYQEQELRDKRAVPKDILDQRLTAAMKTNAKNRSAAYKAKVAYNKANNIKPWEMKKNKF